MALSLTSRKCSSNGYDGMKEGSTNNTTSHAMVCENEFVTPSVKSLKQVIDHNTTSARACLAMEFPYGSSLKNVSYS